MPILNADAALTPHFKAWELNANDPTVTDRIAVNLVTVALWLEQARAALGGYPIDVTSGYRAPAYNATLTGASSTSDHMAGLAADFKPRNGRTMYDNHRALADARKVSLVPPFDQLIYYPPPFGGHIHVGLGARMRGEVRIKLYEGSGGTPILSADSIAKLPGYVADVAADAVDAARSVAPLWLWAAIGGAALVFAASDA